MVDVGGLQKPSREGGYGNDGRKDLMFWENHKTIILRACQYYSRAKRLCVRLKGFQGVGSVAPSENRPGLIGIGYRGRVKEGRFWIETTISLTTDLLVLSDQVRDGLGLEL